MIKIAVLGYGTVGGGVVEVLSENTEALAKSVGQPLEVKYICDVRDCPGDPNERLLVKDFAVIEADPEVSIVVETIGGAGIAYQFTKRALLAGKSVVTSNKELVATKGLELISIAREKNVNYLFEASVGGGIPLLRPLVQCLCANRVDEIYGIVNGTTNYILTRMIQGDDFDSALAQAQANGYAERDPSADIDGIDPSRKISILCDLAFGKNVDPQLVKAEGIRNITLEDVAFADKCSCVIKLLARAVRQPDGVCAYVAPHLIPKDNIISGVSGVMNAAVVRGSAVGEVMFYGPGAGKRFTASAVAADVMDCARYGVRRPGFDWEAAPEGWLKDSAQLVSRWYVRADAPAPVGCVPLGEKEGSCAFITTEADAAGLADLCAGMNVLAKYRVLE